MKATRVIFVLIFLLGNLSSWAQDFEICYESVPASLETSALRVHFFAEGFTRQEMENFTSLVRMASEDIYKHIPLSYHYISTIGYYLESRDSGISLQSKNTALECRIQGGYLIFEDNSAISLLQGYVEKFTGRYEVRDDIIVIIFKGEGIASFRKTEQIPYIVAPSRWLPVIRFMVAHEITHAVCDAQEEYHAHALKVGTNFYPILSYNLVTSHFTRNFPWSALYQNSFSLNNYLFAPSGFCIMMGNSDEFCVVCRHAWFIQMLARVNFIQNYYPAEERFNITQLDSELGVELNQMPGGYNLRWIINGKEVTFLRRLSSLSKDYLQMLRRWVKAEDSLEITLKIVANYPKEFLQYNPFNLTHPETGQFVYEKMPYALGEPQYFYTQEVSWVVDF